MMTSFFRRGIWAAVFVLLFIYGCTAASFSSLQSDFITLYQQKDRCEQAQKKDETLPSECMADYDQALINIAQEAEKLEGKAEDARTRIGILRLGALAAWQAGEKGFNKADDLASKGSRLCESLDREHFGAPRDCAILGVLPALVAHDSWVAQSKDLATKNPEDKAVFFENFAANYKLNTWDVVAKQEALLAKDPKIDASLLLYLRRQKNAFYCTAVKMHKELQEFMDTMDERKAMEKAFNKILNQRDEMDRILGSKRIPCPDLQ
jgi:hypothetical protein